MKKANNNDDFIIEYQLGSNLFSKGSIHSGDDGSIHSYPVNPPRATIRAIHSQSNNFIAILLQSRLVLLVADQCELLNVPLPTEIRDSDYNSREMCWIERTKDFPLPSVVVLIGKGLSTPPNIFIASISLPSHSSTAKCEFIGPFTPPKSIVHRNVVHMFVSNHSTDRQSFFALNIVFSNLGIASLYIAEDCRRISWKSSALGFRNDWQLDSCFYDARKRVLLAIGSVLNQNNGDYVDSSGELQVRLITPTGDDFEALKWRELSSKETAVVSHRSRNIEKERKINYFSHRKLHSVSDIQLFLREIIAIFIELIELVVLFFQPKKIQPFTRLMQISLTPDGRLCILK